MHVTNSIFSPSPVVVCFPLLSLPAGVAGYGAVESGSVVGSLLLPPCSCLTPSATVATAITSPIAIITVIITIINITINICTIFHSVYSTIIFIVCTSMCILCRLPPSALSLSCSLSLFLLLSLSLSPSPPTGRGRWPPTLSHGSARGFCLLKGSFSLPVSPSACSWWELLGFCK